MSSFAAGMFLKTWFGFFASPRCRAMSDDPRRGAEGPGRSRANEKGSGLERPPEPRGPPRGMGLYSAGPKASMGHPASPGPVATAPRYSGSRHGPDETDDQEKKKTKKRRRSRSRSRGRDRRRRGAEERRAEKAMPAERPTLPPPPKPAALKSSDSSSAESSKEDIEEEPEPAPASAGSQALAVPKQTGAVPVWLQAKVDNLSRKAVSFSRALTGAQQALRTSARIAREAAVSFDSELENFQVAQRELDREFSLGAS